MAYQVLLGSLTWNKTIQLGGGVHMVLYRRRRAVIGSQTVVVFDVKRLSDNNFIFFSFVRQ